MLRWFTGSVFEDSHSKDSHLSKYTSRARREVTLLIERNTLPPCYATNQDFSLRIRNLVLWSTRYRITHLQLIGLYNYDTDTHSTHSVILLINKTSSKTNRKLRTRRLPVSFVTFITSKITSIVADQSNPAFAEQRPLHNYVLSGACCEKSLHELKNRHELFTTNNVNVPKLIR